jgi:pimeloyl-ACP methyl ester carboxylesterase/predicted Ser/Thr protein kinase
MIGETISHYKIIEKLGEGGMGVVYKAEDTRLERLVALKIPSPNIVGTDAEKIRFDREAKAAAALDHPNICTIHGIDTFEGQTFIVMAYVDGQSLDKKMELGPLTLNEALSIATQVAEGLQEAHEKDVIHRDIKSANIMVNTRGQAKIMDFGLARFLSRTRVTKKSAVMGTVDYMSPEQASGKGTVDHRSDIWSLGVVLYEMLTGSLPFVAPHDAGVIHKILYENPESITSMRREIPPALELTIQRMLQKDPSSRYESISALLADLKSIQSPPSSPTTVLTESPEIPLENLEPVPLPPMLAAMERSAFVGRDEEIAELWYRWEEACKGRHQIVFLAGEPGIGKTRLVAEFAHSAHVEGATVLLGGTEEGARFPNQPFIEALRHYVAICPAGILQQQISTYGAELTRMIPEINQRLPHLPVLPPPKSDSERYRLFDAFAGMLVKACDFQPVVLILEDLHWAEKETLLLLKHIVRTTLQSPLLILATYRDTELPRTHPLVRTLSDLRRGRKFRKVSLTGLVEKEIGHMIDAWVGLDAPSDVISGVFEQTDGNPFFVEEILLYLMDTGAIYEQNGRCMTDMPAEQMGIPEEVKEIIRMRLARLSDECDSMLTIASVIGHDFGIDALKRASDLSEDRLLELLEEASAARVIKDVPGFVGQYTFCHALIHETLYEDLTTTRRVRLHGQTLQYADNGGVKLAYEVLGRAGPHFIATGLTSCPAIRPRNWAITTKWEHIARFCRVILYDRRGVGFSEAPEKGYELTTSLEDLNSVLDAIGVGRAFIWGATDGGPLAIAYAALHPERAAGLILAGTTPRLWSSDDFQFGINPEALSTFVRSADSDPGTAVSDLSLSRSGAGKTEAVSELMGRIPPHAWSEILGSIGSADALDLLGQVHVPTLIVHDPYNDYIPVEAAHYMHERIADSRLEITEDYGGEFIGESFYLMLEAFIKESSSHK